jgi:hypothetical protein
MLVFPYQRTNLDVTFHAGCISPYVLLHNVNHMAAQTMSIAVECVKPNLRIRVHTVNIRADDIMKIVEIGIFTTSIIGSASLHRGAPGDSAESGRIRARLKKREDMVRRLKQKADSICLTADGVVPLDLACPSSREARLGPTGVAYRHSGIVVATDGCLKRCGSMGASFVATDGRLQARSVAVLGQPPSILPELTGIALAIEACSSEENLTILTHSLSAMRLL